MGAGVSPRAGAGNGGTATQDSEAVIAYLFIAALAGLALAIVLLAVPGDHDLEIRIVR